MKKYLLSLILILCLVFPVNVSATLWDVSTAVYTDKFKDLSEQTTSPTGIFFNTDGSKMYISGKTTDTVYQYALSTSWIVSTASYGDVYKNMSALDYNFFGIAFKPDGSMMYVAAGGGDKAYQYSLPAVGWSHKWNTETIAKFNTAEFTKWNGVE